MIKAKDKKKETLAYRARAKAVDAMMQAAPGMATPAPRGRAMPPAEMAPAPGMSAPGMKKGGKVTAMKKGGKAPSKKPGVMILIAMGKKKGR